MTEGRPISSQPAPAVDLRDTFEADFQALQTLFQSGQPEKAHPLITQLRTGLLRVGPDLATERAARLDTFDAAHQTAIPAPRQFAGTPLPSGLESDRTCLPGVSLVTATRNRTENLLKALPSWLALDAVSEVVIVDWSSDTPVADSLNAAGISDPRIRIARVEHEPKWALTWAFNLGFRLAQHDRILKADADIQLEPDFFDTNSLGPSQFIAGNWRLAPQGQTYLNGLFYLRHADLAAVQGFNEHITHYGWDDDELYGRLTQNGLTRRDLAQGSALHMPHDDAQRMTFVDPATATGWTDLRGLPMYRIRYNRLIATLMPSWMSARQMQPFMAQGTTLRRSGAPPHPVPPAMQRAAEYLAAREMLSWQAGLRALELEDDALDLLLTVRRLTEITAFHVALMLARAPLDEVATDRHLVVDLDLAALQARPDRAFGLKQSLLKAAKDSRRNLVVRGALAPGQSLGGVFSDLTHLPGDTFLGHPPHADLHTVGAATDTAVPVLLVTAGPNLLRGITPSPQAPSVIPSSAGRLFIDAQHGLGNRLRAIGSAAAIARATERDLVVIWEPDHHCEAQLSDLYAYGGTVLEHSFQPATATTTHLTYMEMEDGAAKDAPLILIEGRDAYVRSAYVINHPASHWRSEAAFLRALQPSSDVMALVRGHSAVNARPQIGIHIRMEGAPGTDHNSYDRAENWTAEGHAAINHWRSESHHDRFIARTRQLFDADPKAQAFLAADTPASYTAFEDAFAGRIARLDRTVYDRSASQLQYALADVLLLARTTHLLGSQWSSFTELSLRLSTSIEAHEKAGVDF